MNLNSNNNQVLCPLLSNFPSFFKRNYQNHLKYLKLKVLHPLTHLSKTSVPAKRIAELYRKRWSIETTFQELEAHLHSEINTLGCPKAALFGFCVALLAYNVLALVSEMLDQGCG